MELFPGDATVSQALVGDFSCQGIQHGAHGDHDQHAGDTHQVTTHTHSHQHPHTGQAHGGTNDLGIDKVAFDLLQHQEQHHKPHCHNGVLHQDEECANEAAHKAAHDGNQRSHRNDHTDQRCIGHSEDGHGHGKHTAQNHSFQALAGQEPGEGAAGHAHDADDLVTNLFRQERIQHTASLARQDLLTEQAVEAECDAQNGIEDNGSHAGDGQIHIICHRRQAAGNHGHHILEDAAPVNAFKIRIGIQLVLQFRILCQEIIDKFQHMTHKLRDLIDQRTNGGDQLGHQQQHHDSQDDAECYNGQHHRHKPAETGLTDELQPLLNGTHGHIEDECHGSTHQERRNNAHTLFQQCQGTVSFIQDPNQKNASGKAEKNIAQCLLIHLHTMSLLFCFTHYTRYSAEIPMKFS